MPKERAEKAKELIKESGLSRAKVAKALGYKTTAAFYFHFNKESDISIELFNRIKNYLLQPLITIDKSVHDINNSGNNGDNDGMQVIGSPNHVTEKNTYTGVPKSIEMAITRYEKELTQREATIQELTDELKKANETIRRLKGKQR